MQPKTLIFRTAGTNCDRELAYAFEQAGAVTELIHLNQLIETPSLIEGFDLIGFPGGFSFGDDIAAGRIYANRLRERLLEPLQQAVARGVPMIGICNGFQVLVKAGLLPDPSQPQQTVTLADNASGRFIDRWVKLNVPAQTTCLWTRGLDALELPIAHGEGRFTVQSPEGLEQLQANGQIALIYDSEDNPNGSTADIAGICDPTGLVFGLMPHPERFTHPTHHPQWTRKGQNWLTQITAGLKMFQNAVEHVAEQSTVNS